MPGIGADPVRPQDVQCRHELVHVVLDEPLGISRVDVRTDMPLRITHDGLLFPAHRGREETVLVQEDEPREQLVLFHQRAHEVAIIPGEGQIIDAQTGTFLEPPNRDVTEAHF